MPAGQAVARVQSGSEDHHLPDTCVDGTEAPAGAHCLVSQATRCMPAELIIEPGRIGVGQPCAQAVPADDTNTLANSSREGLAAGCHGTCRRDFNA